ncbi:MULTISPECIES: hypothetical protein [unclassified Flavobacterium]|uniref:hypothetical protein n=1 Tax=unclassified Flavobacterium TaxID=196869 RepID=UPI0012A9AB0A|nr:MULTISPECIES: hypothetical protein [unclassified Flavobacterium]MBF4486190.1 hypothetical protein [Flavobacterium sp. CSZ]QGK76553.1 hypothetical protein GIY83_21505 [Flavobacterium sp. SLB02]
MKFKAAVLFLIVLLLAVSCKEVPASIRLRIEFENKLNQDLSKIYGIQVYKDGKIFKKFSSFEKPYIRKEITLDSLTKGIYKFVYENLVNQTLQKTIEVKDNKVYNISIYPDYSNYKDLISKSFVRNLEENEKVEFYFESIGCFHSTKESLIITKKGKVYYAESKGQSKELSKEQLDAIIKMECELELIKYGSCTTSDHYVVKAGKQEKEFYDESCKWNGWINMSKKLN